MNNSALGGSNPTQSATVTLVRDRWIFATFQFVDRRIAIEFYEPSHLTRNLLDPLGRTRLRDRLLSIRDGVAVKHRYV